MVGIGVDISISYLVPETCLDYLNLFDRKLLNKLGAD